MPQSDKPAPNGEAKQQIVSEPLTVADIVPFLQKDFKLLDRNGDGNITWTELDMASHDQSITGKDAALS